MKAPPNKTAAKLHNPALAAMSEALDKMSAAFEDRKDVKCWTSFKRLETFVAGCQLEPTTTHLKSEIVMDWIDQVWQVAAKSADEPIDGARFAAITGRHFPVDCLEPITCTLKLGDTHVMIPYQDVENYMGTVEPIRLVQTLARRLESEGARRPPMNADAIDAAVRLAALLSTALLKESNRVSVELDHPTIQDEDMMEAAKLISDKSGLAVFNVQQYLVSRSPPRNVPEARDDMLADIRSKTHSLRAFNTTYSKEKLETQFDEDISEHEAEWAELPVDADAARAYKMEILPPIARILYESCAGRHPDSNPLTGSQMLKTILGHFPHVIRADGAVHLFPGSDRVRILLDESKADTFRDTGWHWKALERATIVARETRPELPSMDLYAMEELSEYLSLHAVSLVLLAGQVAARKEHGSVQMADMATAHEILEDARLLYRNAQTERAAPQPSQITQRADAEVRKRLSALYIEEIFTDVTPASGIDFEHENSDAVAGFRYMKRTAAPVNHPGTGGGGRVAVNSLGIAGGGVAVADIDGDDLLDLYLASGKGNQMWKNLGDLRFKNVTGENGLTCNAESRGAYFIDYDNDGDQDLFVTQVYAPNRLFANGGDGTFTDVTSAAGLPEQDDFISHGATWFDFDRDGYLDVYVVCYGDWLAAETPTIGSNSRNGQANALYRNRGDGSFEDVTVRTGTGDTGWGQAVSHFDANNDGWEDIYIANDFGTDVLYLNDGGIRFIDATPGSLDGNFYSGMSVGYTDFNRDGIEDIYVSNIATFSFVQKYVKPGVETRVIVSRKTDENMRMIEHNLFMVSAGDTFADRHHEYFPRTASGAGWAWDADFFDFDNDGQEDLYVANGREPRLAYDMQRNVLYKQHEGLFYDVSQGSNADFRSNARGAVHADFDRDGDLDLIVNNLMGPAVLLRNNLQRNNWMRVKLEGSTSNRDSVGALVKLHTALGVQVRRVRGGSGFLSKEPFAVHFGLGEAPTVEKIEVQWPSGKTLTLEAPEINREHHIVEPS